MPRTAEQTRQLFEAWAKTYDRDLAQPTGMGPLEGYADSLTLAASLVPLEAGDSVLDIGIGTGAFADLLCKRGARITGIDISDDMLDECLNQHPNFLLHTGSFKPIPLPDCRFNVVISSFAFHEVPKDERLEACVEIARVLKAGGYVCLLDIMFASPSAMHEARQLLGRLWDNDEDYALVSDLDRTLREAGFTAIQWQQTGLFHWAVIARKA